MDQRDSTPVTRVVIAAPISRSVAIHERLAEYADQLRVCGVVRDLGQLGDQVHQLQPDVVLLSDDLPGDAADVIPQITNAAPGTAVVVVTPTGRPRREGTVSVDDPARDLMDAIRAAIRSPEPPIGSVEPDGAVGERWEPSTVEPAEVDSAATRVWPPPWLRLPPEPSPETHVAPEVEVERQPEGPPDQPVAEVMTSAEEPPLGPSPSGEGAGIDTLPHGAALEGAEETLPAAVAEPAAAAVESASLATETIPPVSKRVRRQGRARAETFLVFAGKGGVGKSLVATNLAVLLSSRGSKVAILDLDLQYGDVAVLLHVEGHTTSIEALAQQGEQIEAEFLDQVMATGPEQVRALLAPSSPEFADLVTAGNLRAILRELSKAYDYVVVDAPAHLEERVLEVMEAADQILLVTAFTITAIKDSKITLKLLQSLGIERERIGVVLNQTRPKASFAREEVEQSLRFQALCQLPYEPRVDDAIDSGRPLVLAEPRSEFSRQIKTIADYLAPEEEAPDQARADRPAQKPSRRRFSLGR